MKTVDELASGGPARTEWLRSLTAEDVLQRIATATEPTLRILAIEFSREWLTANNIPWTEEWTEA